MSEEARRERFESDMARRFEREARRRALVDLLSNLRRLAEELRLANDRMREENAKTERFIADTDRRLREMRAQYL